MVVNTETHNLSKGRESMAEWCSDASGTSVSHLLSRFRAIADEGDRKIVRARGHGGPE